METQEKTCMEFTKPPSSFQAANSGTNENKERPGRRGVGWGEPAVSAQAPSLRHLADTSGPVRTKWLRPRLSEPL